MPIFVPRFGRPGLIGTAARTAVIAGTAAATTNAIRRRQQERAQEDYQAQQYAAQQQQAQMQAAAQQAAAQYGQPGPIEDAPRTANEDLMDQLQQLGQMHASGVLSDAEFAAAKAKLLSNQ